MYTMIDMEMRATDRGRRLRRQAATYRLLRGTSRRRHGPELGTDEADST
jgi:hypothetical protein